MTLLAPGATVDQPAARLRVGRVHALVVHRAGSGRSRLERAGSDGEAERRQCPQQRARRGSQISISLGGKIFRSSSMQRAKLGRECVRATKSESLGQRDLSSCAPAWK